MKSKKQSLNFVVSSSITIKLGGLGLYWGQET